MNTSEMTHSRHLVFAKVYFRRSHAYREQKRRAEGEDGGDEGRDERPDDRLVQERAGRAENGVRAGPGDVAPHPAHHDQMREEYHGKAQPQRAGRPGKSAADSVESVESNQRTAPDGANRRTQHRGRVRATARCTRREARHATIGALWTGRSPHGRAPSIVTSAGSARTRPSAMAPVTTV